MTWIINIAMGAWKVVTSAVNAFIKNIALFFAYRLGKRAAEAEANEEALEVKDEQLNIAAEPDAHRGTLIERMLKRKRR